MKIRYRVLDEHKNVVCVMNARSGLHALTTIKRKFRKGGWEKISFTIETDSSGESVAIITNLTKL